MGARFLFCVLRRIGLVGAFGEQFRHSGLSGRRAECDARRVRRSALLLPVLRILGARRAALQCVGKKEANKTRSSVVGLANNS